jgi:hypothetical protein
MITTERKEEVELTSIPTVEEVFDSVDSKVAIGAGEKDFGRSLDERHCYLDLLVEYVGGVCCMRVMYI